ncbi:MAG: carboxypeptidase-like regulatory domain-containing protein [Gemmatimonadetes bacterium]|nr:carboxypeptidase-like regulatory domain-containing protein [Gemmatimonadota bacterium]MYG20978.1 carboxypeptidase-like regulatory domain-containing protein [Gemmatimonadota bacterium]MYJ39678.1 carboxypeptidase-like regulatory domain-containing protein [Gemmatimonadota bacterium]
MERRKGRRPRHGGGVVALAAIVLSLPSALEAQTGSIRGQVVDAITQRAIGGAQIEIVGTVRGGLTNTAGQYLLLNVPVGDHEVQVQFIGFGTLTQSVTVVSGETAQLDFQLAQAALQLDQIVVTGTAQETQARSNRQHGFDHRRSRDRGDRADQHRPGTAHRPDSRIDADEEFRPGGVQLQASHPRSGIAGRGIATRRLCRRRSHEVGNAGRAGRRLGRCSRHGRPRLPEPQRHRVGRDDQGPCGIHPLRGRCGWRRHSDHHQEGPRRIRTGVECFLRDRLQRVGARHPDELLEVHRFEHLQPERLPGVLGGRGEHGADG